MYLSMIIILTDFHLLLSESILRTGELLKCYLINLRNALLEGDISIEITSVTVGICIRCICKQLAIIYVFRTLNSLCWLSCI